MKEADLEYLCLEELPDNSVLIIRVDVPGPMEKDAAASSLSQGLSKYENILRKKRVTIMVMTTKESFETVTRESIAAITEEQMNKAGWYRKE